MFVIHGQAGTLDTIVATASAQKAAFHFRRMTRSGLHPVIRDSEGRTCTLRALQLVKPGAAHS